MTLGPVCTHVVFCSPNLDVPGASWSCNQKVTHHLPHLLCPLYLQKLGLLPFLTDCSLLSKCSLLSREGLVLTPKKSSATGISSAPGNRALRGSPCHSVSHSTCLLLGTRPVVDSLCPLALWLWLQASPAVHSGQSQLNTSVESFHVCDRQPLTVLEPSFILRRRREAQQMDASTG